MSGCTGGRGPRSADTWPSQLRPTRIHDRLSQGCQTNVDIFDRWIFAGQPNIDAIETREIIQRERRLLTENAKALCELRDTKRNPAPDIWA